MTRFLGFFLALMIGAPTAIAETRVRLLDDCPDNLACLLATLGKAEQPESGFAVRVEHGSPDQSGIYVVTVRGRLNGSSEQFHDLVFRVGEGELFCTDFVQATVPWIGYSADGNPILLAETGEFEATSNSLIVGCTDCLELKSADGGQTIARYTTPSWDLALTGLRSNDFRWADDGRAFVEYHGRCIALSMTSRFGLADRTFCRIGPPSAKVNPAKEFVYYGPHWLLRIEGNRLVGHLFRSACD